MKKKVRVYLTVDLEVNEDLDIKQAIGVGKYIEYPSGQEVILMKDNDFEVLEYINIYVREQKLNNHLIGQGSARLRGDTGQVPPCKAR